MKLQATVLLLAGQDDKELIASLEEAGYGDSTIKHGSDYTRVGITCDKPNYGALFEDVVRDLREVGIKVYDVKAGCH